MEALTHVTDCPQATALPPEPLLAPSLPGEEDKEEEVDKEPAAAEEEMASVSASFGYHWCNSEQQFLVRQQLPFTAGDAEGSSPAMTWCFTPATGTWKIGFERLLLVISFACRIQKKLSPGCTCPSAQTV